MSRVVVITGASAGIGASLAKAYAKRGDSLALLARRQDKLTQVAQLCRSINTEISIRTYVCDVTSTDNLKQVTSQILNEFKRIDVVIANAGFGVAGRLEKLSLSDYRRQFDVNVFGVLNTVYATLDALKESRGRLAIMGSVNSYIASPGFSAYCMSKFAVKALSDSLHAELKPFGVSVTLICPGIVESEIYKIDNDGKFHDDRKDKRAQFLKVDTDKAVRQMIPAIEKRKREVVVTGHGKALVFAQRHFPPILSPLLKTQTPEKRAKKR